MNSKDTGGKFYSKLLKIMAPYPSLSVTII